MADRSQGMRFVVNTVKCVMRAYFNCGYRSSYLYTEACWFKYCTYLYINWNCHCLLLSNAGPAIKRVYCTYLSQY